MTISDGYVMSSYTPNSRDAEFVKRQAYHDHRVLVVNIDDPRVGWVERQLLENLGEKIYGKPKS